MLWASAKINLTKSFQAARRGHKEVVRLLLTLPNAQDLAAMPDAVGFSAYALAYAPGNGEIKQVFEEYRQNNQ